LVQVEIGDNGQAIRIFKNARAIIVHLRSHGLLSSAPMDRATAVSQIRHQIFERSKGDCELCSSPITEKTFHMHEKQHRGKGGEVSLENSVAVCASCHLFAHRDRRVRFGEKNG
jgi:hypothetical protein